MHRCSLCREYKTAENFTPTKQTKSGVGSHCKPCRNARRRETITYEIARNGYLKSRHGITLAEYDAWFERQGGVCAICGRPPEALKIGKKARVFSILHVDHNHATGALRDLLCNHCNSGIGYMREDPVIGRKMLAYLEKHG